MEICDGDRDVLRALAGRKAEIAGQPIQKERLDQWRRLNDLEAVKPMVWINEVCWHEMDVCGEISRALSVGPYAGRYDR